MALSLATVGAKITAAFVNAIVNAVNQSGWQQIVPTVTGTGAAVSTYGKVTLTACTSFTLTCFSATYDWYEIIADISTSSSTAITGVLGASVTGYDVQNNVGVSATATESQPLNAASWTLNANGIVGRHTFRMTLYDPFLTQETTADLVGGSHANPMTTIAAGRRTAHFLNRASTSYTQITIACGAGSMTGALRIVGMNNG